MGNLRAEELLRKYLEGTATPEEEALLESWYIETAQAQPAMPGEPDYPKMEAEMLEALRAEQQEQPTIKSPVRLWPRIAAAASVLIILGVGSLFVFRKKPAQPIVEPQLVGNDILPAGARATLTLLDGRTIPLDSGGNQTLARQGNETISSVDGQLIYNTDHLPAKPDENRVYNTLTTRPGEHYSLVLPDGTKVWLNAASSITYPVIMNLNERKVNVTGELYFEIVHNSKQPFKVAVRDQLVEDLGTHLNIDAYDDEPTINTTLLEGSVKVSKGSASVTLKPGEQATIRPDGNSFQLKKIDTDQAIAWKNGYFYFDRADIQTVMRQLARWYNVQVIYKGEIPKKTFKGKIYRNIKASVALGILSYFGAHFHIEGKTITVSS
jgi:transmembrane sensor